jgi:PKD repeat protein
LPQSPQPTATTTTTIATSTNASTTTTNTSNTNTIFTPIYSLSRDVIDPPKVYAYAGQNKIILKNVETEFLGKIFDENKKEFRSGDFYWSFGDGTFSREKNVRKVFKKEGEYTVILEVRWNDILDTDKIYIKVINPEVNLKIESGAINIYNNSNDEIDLGNFVLKREDNMMKTFVLPKNFSILPSRSINLESSVTNFGEDIQRVGIYYPSNVLLKIYPEISSNSPQNSFSNNQVVATSSLSAYTLKDFQMLQKDNLLQGVATGSGAKLAKPISLPKFKKKTIYKNNFTQKIATNTSQAMVPISASTDNSIVANNKIILEKPKSFFQNFKESLGF